MMIVICNRWKCHNSYGQWFSFMDFWVWPHLYWLERLLCRNGIADTFVSVIRLSSWESDGIRKFWVRFYFLGRVAPILPVTRLDRARTNIIEAWTRRIESKNDPGVVFPRIEPTRGHISLFMLQRCLRSLNRSHSYPLFRGDSLLLITGSMRRRSATF